MDNNRKERVVSALIPQEKHNTNQKKYDLIYQLLRERHELQQVCLEVYRGLEQKERPPFIELHWHSELSRVLFECDVFLH